MSARLTRASSRAVRQGARPLVSAPPEPRRARGRRWRPQFEPAVGAATGGGYRRPLRPGPASAGGRPACRAGGRLVGPR
eukprot:scaffold14891_cov82-Isochrysis_galbana.AAC.1